MTEVIKILEFELGQAYCINAFDHYSSEDGSIGGDAIMQVFGKAIKETENYIMLAHIKADIYDEHSAIEFHAIFKKAIKDFKLLRPI